MHKIFMYEFLRLVKSKVYWGLAAVTLYFEWQILGNEVILGVANTAPFSSWSYGCYFARSLPFLCAVTLCLMTLYSGRIEREMSALTFATPVDTRKYALARCAAVAVVILALALAASVLAFAFNAFIFGVAPTAAMLALSASIIVPALIFTIGAGWRLGRFGTMPIFILAALFILIGFVPLPMRIDFTGAAFFAEYPYMIGVNDPALSIPMFFVVNRIVMAGLGTVLLVTTKK